MEKKNLVWREFDKSDWDCYAGCESKTPWIMNTMDFEFVLDGNSISAYGYPDTDVEDVNLLFTGTDTLCKVVANYLATLTEEQIFPEFLGELGFVDMF
uniref:Uncharacterized protein n=1 Tax=viral metagenome TaxID=1070528 RepID=A0A6M3LRU1_9ZZZZ